MDRGGYKWLLVALLFLVAVVNYADRTALSAVFPLLKSSLGMSDAALGAVGTTFLWSYGLASPLAGMIGDRYRRTFLVTASLAAWSLVTALTGLATTSFQLLGARVLLGLSESLYIPSALALIGECHTKATRGTAMSLHVAGMQLGFVVGGSLSGFLGSLYGWQAPLFVLGATGLVLALGCHLLFQWKPIVPQLDSSPIDASHDLPLTQALRTTLRVPSFLILATESMLTSVGMWVFAYWLPLYFQQTFNMTLAGAGVYGTAAVSGGGWLGILLGGLLSDKIALRRTGHRMLLECVCYLLAAPFLLSFVWSESAGWVAMSVFFFSLFQTLGFANANPLLCDLLNPNSWSTALGLMNLANCSMAGIGVFAAGLLKEQLGLSGAFLGVMVIQLLAAGLLLLGYTRFVDEDLKKAAAGRQHVVAVGL